MTVELSTDLKGAIAELAIAKRAMDSVSVFTGRLAVASATT